MGFRSTKNELTLLSSLSSALKLEGKVKALNLEGKVKALKGKALKLEGRVKARAQSAT